jgi:hypothetical protein
MRRVDPAAELTIVRLCARALALASVALALALLMWSVPSRAPGRRVEIVSAVEVVIEPKAPQRRRRPVRIEEEPVVMAASATFEPRQPSPSIKGSHLWIYDEQGRIVLNSREQLGRCLNARRLGREAADCPNSHDRRVMISREP